MSRRTRLLGILVTVLPVVLAVAGLLRLFTLRFEQGDLYPAGSSLRADPMGTRILHDSLAEVSPLRVGRLFKPVERGGLDSNTVLVVVAEDASFLDRRGARQRQIEEFVIGGGRLVMAFNPEWDRSGRLAERNSPDEGVPAGKDAKPAAKKLQDEAMPSEGKAAPDAPGKSSEKVKDPPAGEDDAADDGAADEEPDSARPLMWGVRLYALPAPEEEDEDGPAMATAGDVPWAPHSMTWRARMRFEPEHPAWRTVYTSRDLHPVIVERPLGRGTVVLAADTYFLSNEAMLRDREPALLAWLVGPSRRVVFDEYHLGVGEEHGVATLARKYRLGGLAAVLVALGLLYLWRNAVAFLPPDGGEEGAGVTGGIETRDGIISLLRRNIPAARLPAVCLEEWERTRPRSPALDARAERMRKLVEAGSAAGPRDPVALYRSLCELWNETEGSRHE